MRPNFMDSTAKIIAEVRTRTSIDNIDTEVLAEILQDEFIKYHNELFTYAHNIGYDDGYDDGCKSCLNVDVDSAYDEGYSLGYDDGYDEGYALGYDDGHSGVKTLIKRSIT